MTDRFEWLEFDERPSREEAATPANTPQLVLDAARAWSEGDYEGALRRYSTVLKSDRTRLDAWAGQIRCLVRLEEMREAQSWSARACNLFPAVPMLESARAYALASAGLVVPAMSASDAALEEAERSGLSDPRIWYERAVCLLADGQRGTAAFCFDKVREICPHEPEWEQEIALELLARGDAAAAMTCLGEVVDRLPERAYGWILVARAARLLGLRQRAEDALEKAAAIRPPHPMLARELADLKGPWLARLLRGWRTR
jgi:tetratricopeptide (TPR) repeat protein